jgi:uracil-DNA glycosylase
MSKIEDLLEEIKACTICSSYLPLGPNPILSASSKSSIAIIGQAPGTRVHKTGIPWNDPSGERLRSWLGVSKEIFYDSEIFAITPIGFCYPGKGKSGDLPPRPECASHWHSRLFSLLPNIKVSLLIGQYAQKYYLGNAMGKNLTETVRDYKKYLPRSIPLPHPSPRNRLWLKKNPWFAVEVLPILKQQVHKITSEKYG